MLISQEEFNQSARAGFNLIPLVKECPSDLETPLSVYLKLANQPYSYLLESVQGGERFARYSFIGLPTHVRLEVQGQTIQVIHTAEDGSESILESHSDVNPLDFIEAYRCRYQVATLESLPRFCGGLTGVFGYETIRYIEPRLAKNAKADPFGNPEILLLFSTEIVVFDNLTSTLYLVVYVNPDDENAYHVGCQRLVDLKQKLQEPIPSQATQAFDDQSAPDTLPVSEVGEDFYKNAVLKAKEYIRNGDCMQIVLSQRMKCAYHESPLTLYRALRRLNPSPYLFYFDMKDFHVVGASPEILVRLENKTITVKPIAGTRPRGQNREEDQAFAQDLLNDPKEIAEHVMLIDLGRNDVGRVSEIGSVKLIDKMEIERYSHVMHIVSTVEGQLRKDFGTLDVLKAAFPAGTLSGAPKIRAMEIIDELEPSGRGLYGGAVGYIGFNGDMDLAIAIRTALIKDKMLYVQAGAGIVADSVPESEWIETQNKARAVVKAIQFGR